MSIRTILAAALVAGSFAAPAFASDSSSNTIPTGQLEFFTSGQSQGQRQRLVEGRNSDRVVVITNKAEAAISQGFAPVDTSAPQGSNN
jgi:hypothetical protein